MEPEVDHYRVLGLPSGEEGAKLTDQDISKAYRQKALELHPDKRRNDPNAHANFQKLKTSYEILKDETARKLFDDLLRVNREKQHRERHFEAKRKRMVSDLERREREFYSNPDDPVKAARVEEERIKRRLKEEIARVRAMHANTQMPQSSEKDSTSRGQRSDVSKEAGSGVVLDKSKVLKVTWEKGAGDYTSNMLREEFERFGPVEDVVIKSSKKKGSALVVMSSKGAAVAATGTVCGNLSNPLLVLPVQPATPGPSVRAQEPVETSGPNISNLVGAGYKAFEDSVLEKLRKAAQKQNSETGC